MKRTQQVIILLGQEEELRQSLSIISGYKAITVVNSLDDAIIQNIHIHNKNVVFGSTSYTLDFRHFNPIVVRLASVTCIEKMFLNISSIMSDFPKLMDSKNVDIGDHISEDSCDDDSTKSDCLLCKIARGENEKPEHILYESEHFYVVPGLGAFMDGYVMIVPKDHITSIAELDPKTFSEFRQVLNDWRFILESVYKKKVFVFENGSGKNGGGKHNTSIIHAHVHLVPTEMPVLENVQKSGLQPALIQPSSLIKYYGLYPYKLYIDQKNNWFVTSDPETYYPRQHARQILADYMNLSGDEYNWRTNPLREKMDVIADEIYTFLRENYDYLPSWIQKNTIKFLK